MANPKAPTQWPSTSTNALAGMYMSLRSEKRFHLSDSVSELTHTDLNNAQDYSYLRHSIGSSRAARMAGKTPKMRPTPTEVKSPAITAQSGT